MSKRANCRAKVAKLLDAHEELEQLMLRDSALPGRRANLELAAAFADCAAAGATDDQRWQLLLRWAALSAVDAPTNNPREYLPFAAVQAAGALYHHVAADRQARIVELLRAAAGDVRWRTREAAAFGLQRIGEDDFNALRRICEAWADGAAPLELRAILAALAHPPTLSRPEQVRFALSMADRALASYRMLGSDEKRVPGAVALQKGLSFAPSVYVAALPDEGFVLLERWASVDEQYVKKIVAANLRKARLARAFPERVQEVGDVLMA